MGPGPGPDDMAGGCACCGGCAVAELDDGIIGGICSVCRCNMAYKHSTLFTVSSSARQFMPVFNKLPWYAYTSYTSRHKLYTNSVWVPVLDAHLVPA